MHINMSIFVQNRHFFYLWKKQKLKTMNVNFTEKQRKYISDQVKSGDFQNASEVVRDALRLHEMNRRRMLQELKAEIDKGWDGPESKRDVLDIIADNIEKASK